jgi:hypothetical protein
MLERCCRGIIKNLLVTIVGFGLLSQAQGIESSQKVNTKSIETLANEFYARQAMKKIMPMFGVTVANRDDRCNPHQPGDSCTDAVCSKLSKYDCDDMSDLTRVGKICSTQHNGRCIDSVCSRLSKYDCDDFSDIERVANVCEGQYNGRCVDAVCSRMSKYDCDDVGDIQRVTRACSGFHETGCIESVCSRLSKYDCDDLSDLEKVIASCKGR